MNDNSMLYLVLLGFASGFINMFAGGGSMLVVPFLIFLGLPPHVLMQQPGGYSSAKYRFDSYFSTEENIEF